MDYFISAITIVISISSLIVAIKAYRLNRPQMKIDLLNVDSSFYGATQDNYNGVSQLSRYMAGVCIRIRNPSPKDIVIGEISLQYAGQTYDIADPNNEVFEEVIFYYQDGNEITWNGSCIDYKNTGVTCPFPLEAYGVKDCTCLFLFFPKMHRKWVKAKVVVNTAFGKIKKCIILQLYDKNYGKEEVKSIEQFTKSL